MDKIDDLQINRRNLFKLSGAAMAGLATQTLFSKKAMANEHDDGVAYVPPEEAPLSAVWMAYPHSTDIWGNLLPSIQKDWGLVARTIAKYTPLYVICGNHADAADEKIGDTQNEVTFVTSISNDDMWARDSGCVFRRDGNGALEGIKLNFNGWGNQQTSDYDSVVADGMCSHLGIKQISSDLNGEGGGVICDGEGTLIANWSSWTGHNRNPGWTKNEVGTELMRVYNAQKIIWCNGIVGQEITDAHIDAVCAFIRPGVIAIHRPPKNAQDEWSKDALNTHKILQNTTDARGRKFEFIFLDEPVYPRSDSPDLLATYINFLVLDKAVITANFGDTNTDLKAMNALAKAYPGKKVEMLKLDNIYGKGGGGIHCITQQQPTPY